MSEEQKQKLSEAHTGKSLSEEHKQNISKAFSGENHPMYGKHWPEEVRNKMRGPRGPHKNPRKSKRTEQV